MNRLLLPITIVLTASSSCLFLPAIEDDGYTSCTSNVDCAVGRACALDVGLCAPPPWNDPTFRQRRAVIVTNPADVEIAAGTAIPVNVGGDNATFALEDIGFDARYVDFDGTAWNEVPVYLDRFADRFTIWAALSRPLPAGGSDVLFYVEQNTEAGTPTVVEAPTATFTLFDELDDFPTDKIGGDRYVISAPEPATIRVAESLIGVTDNTSVTWRQALTPPLSVTFKARVVGLNCSQVSIGLGGKDDGRGLAGPLAVFFIKDHLQTTAQVAAVDTGRFEELSAPRIFSEQPNAVHRFTIDLDDRTVRFLIDDVVFDERDDLRPAFAPDAKMFPLVEVDGACSVEVEALWATTLPTTRPTLRLEAPVVLNITF